MGGMDKIHITFYKLKRPEKRKTDKWEIITLNKACLGFIKFNGAWRQFVFEPSMGTYWSHSCLKQVEDFLKEQNARWRRGLVKR